MIDISKGGDLMIQEINVQVDKQAIQKHIEKQLDDCIQAHLWFVDAEKVAELTCMSVRFLNEEIFTDPRMRVIEKRKNRKRWWPAQQALQVISEITDSW